MSLIHQAAQEWFIAKSIDPIFMNLNDQVDIKGKIGICPIFTGASSRNLKFLATAFYISSYGLFVTAKHVILSEPNRSYDSLFIMHFFGDNKYVMRPIMKVIVHNTADIAIGIPYQHKHNVTNDPIPNKVLVLTKRIPAINEVVSTFAYPDSEVSKDSTSTKILCKQAWHHGSVSEHFKTGRDKVMLPSECFRTTMEIRGGASGGPVFDVNGRVFGINSTGWDGTQDSYVTSLSPVWDMKVSGVTVNGTESPTVQELVRAGYVTVH